MAYRTISILPVGIVQKEGTVAVGQTITPGQQIEETGSGVLQHSAAGGNVSRAFAIEDDIQGNGIDDTYAAGSNIKYRYFGRGSEVYAWLAAGEIVAVNDRLESNGAGLLQLHTAVVIDTAGGVDKIPVPDGIVARAVEVLDLTATGAVATRLRVEIL